MALATQCPHCHTTFRVAHDQLKLRAGLVRCGSCKQIFNGIENLLRPEELAQASPPPPKPQPQPAPAPAPAPVVTEPEPPAAPQPAPEPVVYSAPEETADQAEPAQEEMKEPPAPALSEEAAEDEPAAHADTMPDPMLRMTLLDVAHERREPVDEAVTHTAVSQEADALEQTIDDLQSKPWRKEPDASDEIEGDALDHADATDYEEPAFVRQARRRQRIGRALRIAMATGSVLLLAALLAQGAYVFRDQIAARYPEARPALAEACAHLGCQVGLPAEIESVAIEASELQTLSENTFVLTALLRNQASTAQAWPHIELTLNDANGGALVRRVFGPRDYLPPAQDFNQGFDPDSEQPIKLFFELAQLKASGYRVYLFYP